MRDLRERRRDDVALPSTRLRVVHVVLSLDCGGLEHVVTDLARTGREAGQDVSVICLERPGVLASQAETDGVPVRCLGKPPGLQLGVMRRGLRPLLAELRPDVVHSHQIGSLFYAAPVARAAGVPAIVHTEHGRHFGGVKSRWLGRYAAWHADRFFCVSRDIADEVAGRRVVSRCKVAVVPNGIDTRRFAGGASAASDAAEARRELRIPPDAPLIGTVGRLADVKRQDLLLRAFALVLKESPLAYLLLVGDGPQREALEQLATELGIDGRVRFAGYREDRERLLRAMNLFTLTSRYEAMPLSVLEAWAAGIPVAAAQVGGLPELIDDGRNGILVAGEDPTGWAAAFVGLLRETEWAKRIAMTGRERVETRHSLRSMLDDYEERYREVLAGRTAVRRTTATPVSAGGGESA